MAFATETTPRYVRALSMLLLATSLGVGLGACSSLFGKDETPPDEPPERLYNEGLFVLNNKKDAKKAVERFEEVDRQHPYSEWARKSLIMSAYAYYQAGS
jgi:outer membrane protein assembly factor BamD